MGFTNRLGCVVRIDTWLHTSKFPFTSKIAPNFILVILPAFLESWQSITHQKDSHQNRPVTSKLLPFHFSYHEDHRAGYHAECLNRWNVMTPQKNSTFCNNMIFIHSLILPRYSMATAKNLLAYNSGE